MFVCVFFFGHLAETRCMDHSCIFRSVPTGTDRKSRTGMQTGTRHPPIPPRVNFRGVSAVSVDFGVFRPVCIFRLEYFSGFFSLFSGSRLLSPLSFDLSASPPPVAASSFKPSTTWGNHREKNKKFLPQFLSVLFSLVDGRQYREENDERNRGKTSKRNRIE